LTRTPLCFEEGEHVSGRHRGRVLRDNGEKDQQVVGGGQPGIGATARTHELEVVVHQRQSQRQGLQLSSIIHRPPQAWRPGHSALLYFLNFLFVQFSGFSQEKPFSDTFGPTCQALLEQFSTEEIAQASLEDLAAFIQRAWTWWLHRSRGGRRQPTARGA
jgi:hypothetical protein